MEMPRSNVPRPQPLAGFAGNPPQGVPPPPPRYASPYAAGAALGGVLLLTFLVMGHGLGASGAFARLGVTLLGLAAPAATKAHAYFSLYLSPGRSTLNAWIVYEVVGVLVGAYVSGLLARRLRWEAMRGRTAHRRLRLPLALLGGVLVGFAARLAGGCTSGIGLSGGAVLAAAGWLFILCFFAGGYLAAPAVRREWQ